MSTLYDYFIAPIMQNGWYNPVNTMTYAIILVIAVFAVFRLLKRMDIAIDRNFFLAILPFVFWGSSARVLKDAATANALSGPAQAIFASPFWVTPGSYIITFSLALLVLLLSLLIQRITMPSVPNNINFGTGITPYDFQQSRSVASGGGPAGSGGLAYWKSMLAAGILLCAVNVAMMPVVSWHPFLLVGGITAAWALVFYLPHLLPLASKRLDFGRLKELFSPVNSGILSAHLFDASATFVALSYFGYLEQHVVPRLFIPFMGPAAMFFLKLVVVIPVLYLIDRYAEKGSFRNFLKICVLILGLAPGLRDVLRLVAGV